MDGKSNRVGKLAVLLAVTSDEEEKKFRETMIPANMKAAVTYVAGVRGDVQKTFVKTLVGAALHGQIFTKESSNIHAAIHAGLEAMQGIIPLVAGESSLKLKIAIVADGKWLAVAAYGESAFHPETNHERFGFGLMHL